MTRVTFELTDGIRRRLVEDPIAWLTTVSPRAVGEAGTHRRQ